MAPQKLRQVPIDLKIRHERRTGSTSEERRFEPLLNGLATRALAASFVCAHPWRDPRRASSAIFTAYGVTKIKASADRF